MPDKLLPALFLWFSSALALCAMSVNALPVIEPQWTDKPVVMDGRLDDPVWKAATPVGEFVAAGKSARASTQAYLAYDGKALYAAFHCQAPPESLDVANLRDGAPVWQDESVELFVAPWNAPDSAGLYHFVVNAASAKAFLRLEEIQENVQWTAVTNPAADGWTAEIRVPLTVFKDKGPNEGAWRVLFGRNAAALKESSSWPDSKGRFAYFWNYAELVPPKGRPSFLMTGHPVRPRTRADQTPGVSALKQIAQAQPEYPIIIPQPKHLKMSKASFALTPATKIVIPESAAGLAVRAAEILADWVKEKTGFRLAVQRGLPANLKGCIVVAQAGQAAAIAPILAGHGERISAGYPGKEGYVIAVDAKTAVVAGCDEAGVLWGAQTLAQMIRRTGGGVSEIAGAVARDRPTLAFRSVHLLTAKDTYAFQTKLIRTVLSPMKINYVILQMDKYDWQSHPEITDPDNHVSAPDIKKLVAYARSYGITYVPLVMSLGHMEWIFRGGHHLDIAEDPAKPYAYCPLNPKSYELMYDLFDEAYELFGRPGLFHIGHDEFDMIGQFPAHEQCMKLGKEELYFRDTLRLVAHLRKMGARTMMWGDILQKTGFREHMNRLPKDVIIVDWHYGPKEDYPSVDFFRKEGHEVIGGAWYLPENIYYFSKYASEHGAMGMMQTTWSGWETADLVLKKWPEQMCQYVSGAAWAWSPGVPPLDGLPYDAQTEFDRRWGVPAGSSKALGALRPAEGELFSVNLGPYANVPLMDTASRSGWIGLGQGRDFSQLTPGTVRLGSVTYRVLSSAGGKPAAVMLRGPRITSGLPQKVSGIGVNSTASQLWFLHTAAYADGRERQIGSYRVRYSDGGEESIPLVYGRNITSWMDAQPASEAEAAWRGVDGSGKGVRLRALGWTNPHPEKTIESIDFEVDNASLASPALVAITGIRQPGKPR